jgi:hypothetical protein
MSVSLEFQSTLARQLNRNRPLSKDHSTRIKAGILCIKPRLLTTAYYDNMLNFGCDFGVYFLNTPKARIAK